MDRTRKNTKDVFALYLDGVRIENETGEWTALDVFSLVGDGNLPFTNFIRLKSGRKDSVVIAHRTSKDPICRGRGFNLDRTTTNTIRVNLVNDLRKSRYDITMCTSGNRDKINLPELQRWIR